MKRKQKQTYLVSKEELILIQLFILKKMTLKESIEIVCNRDVDLLACIRSGKEIIDSDTLKQQGIFYKYLRILMSYNSFEESICLANDFSKFNNTIKSKILSLLTYPMILILFATGIYLLFSYNLLPMMLNLIDLNSMFMNISDLLITINDILISLFLIFIIVFLYVLMKVKYRQRIINSFRNKKLIKEYNSYLFSLFYRCLKPG